MAGSPFFSVNFTNRNNPATPNYHLSIKKSQAKCTEYRTAGHLVFWKLWPAFELTKVLSVTKHGFAFWAQRKPNAVLEIYKAFRDRLTFLNRQVIVWCSWIISICEIYWKERTAGHLVFWKPWPVTGHISSHSVFSILYLWKLGLNWLLMRSYAWLLLGSDRTLIRSKAFYFWSSFL